MRSTFDPVVDLGAVWMELALSKLEGAVIDPYALSAGVIDPLPKFTGCVLSAGVGVV